MFWLILTAVWGSFLIGFIGALWLFPRPESHNLCAICNREIERMEHIDTVV